MVTWLLFDWQWPFWLAISYMTLLLRREPGPLQGTTEPGWSGDGNSRTVALSSRDCSSPSQGSLQPQIHEGHCSASSKFSKWRCSDWISLVGKFVLSYCFSWYRDSRSDDPGRKQLKSESFCSLSLSHMDWFREGNSVSPPCVWLLQPSALGNRIFLSSNML